MKIIPFEELYNTEFYIKESIAKGQNWYNRGNFYGCIDKPKPSHTFLWFKSCHGKITTSRGEQIFVEKNQLTYMSKGIEYTVDFYDTAPNVDDTVVFHFQLFDEKGEEIAPTLDPIICIKSVDPSMAMVLDSAAAEFLKNIACVPEITSAIYQIFSYVCKKQRRRNIKNKYSYILKGIELMENDSDMTLSEIAHVCGVSEGHFRKLFREYSGENPIDFRQRHRIEKAKRLLVSDTVSVESIAMELHFSDIYHFSKTFKKIVGVSPKKYIKQN